MGIEPVAQHKRHCSHIHKVLDIVIITFLPNNNDIKKLGKEFTVSMEISCLMLPEKKYSTKIIYIK